MVFRTAKSIGAVCFAIGTFILQANVTGSPTGNLAGPDVLVLVNANSPVSISIADLYRSFHPDVPADQVLYLYGLPDCASMTAGPAHEIITRAQFDSMIAAPVRNYLLTTGKLNSIYCMVTTAGMPYRIEDTDPTLANVIKPAGSDASLVGRRSRITAASVESELAVLWQIDSAVPSTARMPTQNRIVNPYQGYRSGIKSWAYARDMLGRRGTFRWTYMSKILKGPTIEGEYNSVGYSSANRRMSPADIYLVTRLDGPRDVGYLPIFSVKRMLHRAAQASDPTFPAFVGYNPWSSVMAIDFAPTAASQYSYGDTYNVPPQFLFLTHSAAPIPPGAESFSGVFNEGDHFFRTFQWLSGQAPDPISISYELAETGLQGILAFDPTNSVLNQGHLPPNMGVIGLMTYGCNGGDGRTPSYLVSAGPGGGPLVKCVPGAVFCSIESFNAVTMFTSPSTGQGKISQFLTIGGSGAIGHAFEPEAGAIAQGEFLFSNLIRDDDLDGTADLCWAEAAVSALPYLSWSEVILGDPLMRLTRGPGGLAQVQECPGDANDDGRVTGEDIDLIGPNLGQTIGQPGYVVGADLDEDGAITKGDLEETTAYLGHVCR